MMKELMVAAKLITLTICAAVCLALFFGCQAMVRRNV